MTPPLTDNQTILLRAVTCSGEPLTTAALAALNKASGEPFGDDAARSALKRLRERDLVALNEAKRWVKTPAGIEIVAPEDESGIRRYVVLEEKRASELVNLDPDAFVYVQIAMPEARNTEHALRQTAKEVYVTADADPTLVAVATKMWKPTPVRITTRQTVSVG